MPRSSAISRAGYGKPGYCSLCQFREAVALNDLIRQGWNSRQCIDWLQENHGFSVSRDTFYQHKRHLTRPEDRIVTAVQKAQATQMLPRVSSNEQFLEAIRDIGYKRAVENPDEVTIDHGLKAASILSQQKGKSDITFILAKIVAGNEPEIVEGEARVVEAGE